MTTHKCTKCGEHKSPDQFYKSNTTVGRRRSYRCIQCTKQVDKQRRDRPAYNSYDNVKKRCNLPSHGAYKWYGAKGITYDKQLFKTYKTFWSAFGDLYRQAELLYPGEKLTIDRIDNNGDYVEGNIRFVPQIINENNRSDNYYIEWNGVRQSASMWAREFNLPPRSLIKRHKAGWSMYLISIVPNDSELVRAITLQIKQTKQQAIDAVKGALHAIEK